MNTTTYNNHNHDNVRTTHTTLHGMGTDTVHICTIITCVVDVYRSPKVNRIGFEYRIIINL